MTENQLLRAALFYASLRWAVHPLQPGDKRPLLKDWPRRASTDLATIQEWRTRWPQANIGLACGAADLVVIDLDVKGKVNGVETWRKLQVRHADMDVGQPPASRTPSSGFHVFYDAKGQLEVWPALAAYAPAIFPALTVVGALNLALVSRQEQREATVFAEKAERRAMRRARRQATCEASNDRKSDTNLDALLAGRRAKRKARMDALLSFYGDHPGAGPTDAGQAIGVSRQTVYTYLTELERDGRIARTNGQVTVLKPID